MNEYAPYLLLMIIGFVTGVINTISGGGSALSLPALILLGLPPVVANGTNRISVLIQSIASLLGFKSKGVSYAPFPGLGNIGVWIAVLLGAIIGAAIAIDIKGPLFNKILAVVIVIVVFGIIVKPKTAIAGNERLTGVHQWMTIISFFFIGIYAGFIQAGTGIIMILTFSLINRISLVAANAAKSMIVILFTIASMVVFAYYGHIHYSYGLLMGFGSAGGGWVASRWSVNKGDGLVKIFLVITVVLIAIKLWWDS